MVRIVRDQPSMSTLSIREAPGALDPAPVPVTSTLSASFAPAPKYHHQCFPSHQHAGNDFHTLEDPKHSKPKYTVIKAQLLIPGDSEPIEDAALVIEDDTIAWVGAESDIPVKYTLSKAKEHTVPILMPGLWECHVHFEGMSPGSSSSYAAIHATHPASCGARLAKGLWETINSGYTSIRDMGGLAPEVAEAVVDGTLVGPHIYGAGSCISQLGGHGDIHELPAGTVLQNYSSSHITPGNFGTNMMCIADGVDDVRRAVRMQIRRKARVIKIMASGGVMSRDDDPQNQQFSDEELKVAVEEAERQQRIVAAHVHGKAGIMAAIRAGCKSLEHVSYADEECLKLMKEKDVLYVATRGVVESSLASNGARLGPEQWKKLKALAGSHLHAYQLAVKTGVKIALGTDAGPGYGFARELEWAVKAGMTPYEAIRAGTAMGPLSIGPQAPLSGQLKAGYDADIIALKDNPLEDVKVLQKINGITHVWKSGKLYKGPGVGPWGEE